MGINIICATCKGENVTRNCDARWHPPIQEWEISATFDNFYCEDCGNECDVEETPLNPKDRLEYLRQEIEAERISMSEIDELQSLAEHIDPSDTLLLQWAGVPEQNQITQGATTMPAKRRDDEAPNMLARKITIDFNWWRSDNNDIDEDHNETLIEDAEDRILPMMRDGYVEGNLHTNIHTEKGEIEYTGYWKAEISI